MSTPVRTSGSHWIDPHVNIPLEMDSWGRGYSPGGVRVTNWTLSGHLIKKGEQGGDGFFLKKDKKMLEEVVKFSTLLKI